MKKLFRPLVLSLTALGVACSQPGATPASPGMPTSDTAVKSELATPVSATMDFGVDTTGSPFPPPSGHDQSSHAKDNIVPRTVVIDRGGTVTFKMGPAPVHQVAIYDSGTEPSDIDTTILLPPPPAPCPPVPLINDPNNRLAFLSAQLCAGGSPAPTYTFTEPGRYLVICTFLPHFNVGMYGWVIVRDR